VDIQFFQQHLLKRLGWLFFQCMSCTSLSKTKWLQLHRLSLLLCTMPLGFVSTFVPTPWCFYCYSSIV
jgi:hypothetical protein